ncbi:MAG: CopG family transcriptional regulator [Acidimicrobiales bacterium]
MQLTEELLGVLDERAAKSGRSRSELIREAIERYVADDISARIDAAVVSGYERMPQEPDVWGEVVAREVIAAEPW